MKSKVVSLVLSLVVLLTGAAYADAVPDLVALPITYASDTIAVGETVYFDTGIMNAGDADTDSFNIKWFVNQIQTGYGAHEGIAAGETVTEGNSQFYWTPQQAGTYTIRFVVDADNDYDDSNPMNSESYIEVQVIGKTTTASDSSSTSAVSFHCILESGGLTIAAYVGSEINVVIPETIDGYTVQQIGSYAFCWSVPIKSVTIPDSVIYIEPTALCYSSLQRIYVTEGSYAQQWCIDNGYEAITQAN